MTVSPHFLSFRWIGNQINEYNNRLTQLWLQISISVNQESGTCFDCHAVTFRLVFARLQVLLPCICTWALMSQYVHEPIFNVIWSWALFVFLFCVCVFYFFMFCFLFCVFCDICIFSPRVYDSIFSISVQLYWPLWPGGNPIAVKKYIEKRIIGVKPYGLLWGLRVFNLTSEIFNPTCTYILVKNKAWRWPPKSRNMQLILE